MQLDAFCTNGSSPPADLLDRYLSKFEIDYATGCWVWTGDCSHPKGYGAAWIGRTILAHRLAYLLFHGELPPSPLQIDHLCRNRLCVNPDHLEAVTPAENNRRAADANGRSWKESTRRLRVPRRRGSVSYHRRYGKWQARGPEVGDRQTALGYYRTRKEAEVAVRAFLANRGEL